MTRYAVIGDPIAHSLSPIMHRAALEASGVDASYDPIRVRPEELGATLAEFWDSGMAGFNITLPHKQSMFAHCAEVDEVATKVGAINTVWRGERGWCATNTDAEGFVRSLLEMKGLDEVLQGELGIGVLQNDLGAGTSRKELGAGTSRKELGAGTSWKELAERTQRIYPEALVLGAGGAARAVVVGLQGIGVKVTVSARRPGAAEALQGLGANVRPWGGPLEVPLVVNATSASLHHAEASAQALPFRAHHGQTFVDLVYTPRETPFLRRARELGAHTIDGSGMLLHQGAIAFERWHQTPAPLNVMRRALDAALDRAALPTT